MSGLAPHLRSPFTFHRDFNDVYERDQQVDLTAIVAPLFITTLGMLTLASISFLLEVHLATDFVQRKF